MTKLAKGTTQAYLSDHTGRYEIEQWDGRGWSRCGTASFDNKRDADAYGFRNFTKHKR